MRDFFPTYCKNICIASFSDNTSPYYCRNKNDYYNFVYWDTEDPNGAFLINKSNGKITFCGGFKDLKVISDYERALHLCLTLKISPCTLDILNPETTISRVFPRELYKIIDIMFDDLLYKDFKKNVAEFLSKKYLLEIGA